MFVLLFDNCDHAVAHRIGGKARGLGALARSGLPVPPGFVVTTEAFHAAISAAGIDAAIAARLREIPDPVTPVACERASHDIAQLFAEVTLPVELDELIVAEYERLAPGEGPVAVRSSATAEDLGDASFAGQQETYLWVTGADDVKASIVRCWASLFTPQAIGYRSRMDVAVDDLAMAVVVQRMVPARAAGVMMTLEPVTGDRSQLYVEATYGLGEGVVRGDVASDSFWVGKAPFEIVRRTVNRKTHAHRPDLVQGGVELVAVAAGDQLEPCLSEDEVLAVARLGVAIEEDFGHPVDVEWAVTDEGGESTVHLLQARPETVWSRGGETSGGAPVTHDDPLLSGSRPNLHWTVTNIGEAMPGVQTPLSATLWTEAIEQGAIGTMAALGIASKEEEAGVWQLPMEAPILRPFFGRLAIQVEYFAHIGNRMPGTTGPDVVQSILASVPDDLEFHPTRRYYASIARRAPVASVTVARRIRESARENDAWYARRLAELPGLDRSGTVACFNDAADHLASGLTLQGIGLMGAIQPLYDAVDRLVRRTGVGDVGLLSGSGGAETAVIDDAWEASRGALPVEEVVRRHGFHGPFEGELSSRVWREDQAPLHSVISQYAGEPDTGDPRERERRRRRAAREMSEQLVRAVPRWQRPAVRLILRMAAKLIPLRGVAKRSFLQAFDVARASSRQLGALLVDEDILTDPDDVFYLTLEEVRGALPEDIKARVVRRRALRARYQRMRIPGDWTGVPEPLDDSDRRTGTLERLDGIGVSGGCVEGRVRVVLEPHFAEVEPGEILVAPFTDPGWATIMFIAGALVVDIGGALSHAAVVARELGLPCVVNTQDGTRTLHTGDVVRVDGDAGTVEILERAGEGSAAPTGHEPATDAA